MLCNVFRALQKEPVFTLHLLSVALGKPARRAEVFGLEAKTSVKTTFLTVFILFPINHVLSVQ